MEGLDKYIRAQELTYLMALQEVQNGRKKSHWIWYVFPQLKGLGHSHNSKYYGIESFEEARSYINHPILGARIREITRVLLDLPDDLTAARIFGGLDAIKVRSSMTLFYLVSREVLFLEVINRYYNGILDKKTMLMLSEP